MASLERPDMSALTSTEITAGMKGCKPCLAGWFCPDAGMIQPEMCGTGFYSDVKATECTICPFDSYCDSKTTGLTAITKCPSGYICPEGLGVKPYKPIHACPAGYYCQDSVKYECPAGTYNALTAMASASACIQVPAGYYTSSPASTSYDQNLCKKGYYCPAGSTSGEA